jgi:hypothetical protein
VRCVKQIDVYESPDFPCSKPWIGQGIRFGILLALVVVLYRSLSAWVIMPVPPMLLVKWIVGESLLSVVFGLTVAGICKA